MAMPPVALLLKLAAASLSGAAALLSWRKLRRDESLFYQRRDILRRCCSSSSSPPPSVLVVGFRAHGKSSFVNTACRVMAGEDGPLVLRSETAPTGSPTGLAVTRSERTVRVTAGWMGEVAAGRGGGGSGEGESDGEVVVVEMVDTPGLSGVGDVGGEVKGVLERKSAAAAECVVVVMRCPGLDRMMRKASLRKLEEIAGVVREQGLLMVIVLTHKNAMKNVKQAEDLRDEVAVTARTDSVYLIDNYTASGATGIRYPYTVNNTFDTHFNVLAIIRQCMEFALIHRSHLPQVNSIQHDPQKPSNTKSGIS